jgi:hypothetical protein
MVACAQCRQRKVVTSCPRCCQADSQFQVRCESGPNSCEACTRLGFQCSYSAPATSGSGAVPTATRKRGARACDACRSQRARCTGGTPSCLRCQQLKTSCNYSLSVRQYRARDTQRPNSATSTESYTAVIRPFDNNKATHSISTTASDTVASPTTSISERVDTYALYLFTLIALMGFRFLGCEKAVVREHIDAYFSYIYPIPLFSFLHRADFLNQYTAGTVSPALLLAVCAVSSRFLSSTAQAAPQAKSWIDKAERLLFQTLGRTTLESIQTLLMIGLHFSHSNHTNKSFLYVALAARMAVWLKLHKEDSRLSFVDQECRRRMLWCIFILDRFQAGGVAVST